MPQLKITSKIILNALAIKHSEDVFITECKTGASYNGCPRMDAWVMKKSWASPLTDCYEIKMSRADFLGDTKWPTYLPYCNELYFVCPPKLITIEEVPENAGLMYISSTGTRIFTKKKAMYREVEISEDLWRYILMWRTAVTREHSSTISKKEFWKNWLEQREIDTFLGHSVGKALKETIEKEVLKARRTNVALEERLDRYDYLTKFLEEIGVNPKTHYLRSEVKDIVQKREDLIPRSLRNVISWTKNKLEDLLEEIEDLDKLNKKEITDEKTQ